MADVAAERLYPTAFSNSPLLPLLLLSLATQRHTPKTSKTFKKEYDYIIVGAGTAGSVLASRLSEIKCTDVLLLEAGGDPPLLTEIPLTLKNFVGTDVDWQFRVAPQKYTAAGHVNRQTVYAAGRMLGGSSVLSDRLSARGNPKTYDDWAAKGAVGWSYKELFPYFIRMEDNTNPKFVASGFHGTGGPITMSSHRYHNILYNAIKEATLNLGYGVVDSDGPQQIGFTIQQGYVKDGQGVSTAKGYLVPVENRENLDIVKNSRVIKVLIENRRAIGIVLDDMHGHRHIVTARKEVILSAGAVNTPKLLMLSGIGPVEELTKHEIPVIADLPVGKNLVDHATTLLFYDVSTVMEPFGEQLMSDKSILAYIHNRTGPLTLPEGALTTSYFNNKMTNFGIPDFLLYGAFAFDRYLREQTLWDPQLVEQLYGPYKDRAAFSCFAQVFDPKSRGSVRLHSSHPYDSPIVDPNYFESLEDVEASVASMKTCRKIFESYPFQRLGVQPFKTVYRGCENVTYSEDLYYKCIARTAIYPLFHPAGTAKMGDPSDPTTVVDPLLRVKTIKGLRVVDASVFPTMPGSSPLVTTVAMAEKAADIIKDTVTCGGLINGASVIALRQNY